MPNGLAWSHAQDTQIRRRRTEGASWEIIAAELALPLPAVVARGRRIAAPRPDPDRPAPFDPEREALPAGHPDTWGVIIAGTVLHDTPYPLRFFRR